MHSWYRAFAIGVATLLLALAAQVATGHAQPDSQATLGAPSGPLFDDRRQLAPPGSTYSMGVLHAESHDGVQTEVVVPHTPPALLQSERDAILTGSDVLASRLSSVHPQTFEQRTQERLLVDGEIAIEHVGTPATPGWGMEQPQLLGGLAVGLLGCVLVVLRPRSPRPPSARRRQLLQGLRAWLTSQTASAER